MSFAQSAAAPVEENTRSAILTSTEDRPGAPAPTGGTPGQGWTKSTMKVVQRSGSLLLEYNGQVVDSTSFTLFPMDATKDIDFTWHHNVPWEDLRQAWNIIAVFCRSSEIVRLFKLYRTNHPSYIEQTGLSLLRKIVFLRAMVGPGTTTAGTRTCGQWMTHLRNYEGAEPDQWTLEYPEERDMLLDLVCWQGWNIVEGPKETVRTDDPGSSGFDGFLMCDPNIANRRRHVAAQRMYATMRALIEAFDASKDLPCSWQGHCVAWSDALADTLNLFDGVPPDERNPIGFRQEMWVCAPGTGGPVEIKNSNGKKVWKQMKSPGLSLS